MSFRQGIVAWEAGLVLRRIDRLAQSLELSRRQGARALLQPVPGQFVEGLDIADLKSAGRVLATLG